MKKKYLCQVFMLCQRSAIKEASKQLSPNVIFFYLAGMSCGSYTTNTAVTLKYICEHAPIDLLVIQDRQLLDKLLQDDPELSEIVKSFILIDETGHRIGKNNILTWQELLENGRNIPDSILQEKEKEQVDEEEGPDEVVLQLQE